MADSLPSSSRLQKRKRRPIKSCERCRLRKVKCDLGHPCGPCTKAKAPLNCEYVAESTISPIAENNPVGVRTPQSITTRSSDVSATNHPINHTLCAWDSRRAQTTSQTTKPQSSLSVDEQHPDLPSRERLLIPARLAGPSINIKSPNDPPYVKPSSPRLSVSAEKTKVFGHTHWIHTASLCYEISNLHHKDISSSIAADNIGNGLTSALKEVRRLRKVAKMQQNRILDVSVIDLFTTIPEKEVCDDLVGKYARTFEVIYRIIHIPSFLQDYNEFFANQRSTSEAFRFKLILILAIGTTFCTDEKAHFQKLARTWIYAAQWWLNGPSEKCIFTLEGFQVACLLQLARAVTAVGISSWVSSGNLIRMARMMGLHRDPDNFATLSGYRAQMSRRLWAASVELSLLNTYDSGTSLDVNSADSDTKPPADIDDVTFDRSTEVLPLTNEQRFSDHSTQRILLKSLPTRLRVASIFNRFKEIQDYQTSIELGNELMSMCRDIVNTLSQAAETKRPEGTFQPTKFHVHFLDIYFRKLILLLHRPFVVQGRTDPKFYYSRKICLECALVIASYSKTINLPSSPPDDLSILFTVTRGSINAPFGLDVITILGLEVLTQIQESESSSSLFTPASTIAKASRAPVIEVLEHIHRQLLEIVALGSPSLKRYIYLSVMLAQIRATETGTDVMEAVKDGFREAMNTLRGPLEMLVAQQGQDAGGGDSAGGSGSGMGAAGVEVLPTPSNDGFFDLLGTEFDFGDPQILGLPGMGQDWFCGG